MLPYNFAKVSKIRGPFPPSLTRSQLRKREGNFPLGWKKAAPPQQSPEPSSFRPWCQKVAQVLNSPRRFMSWARGHPKGDEDSQCAQIPKAWRILPAWTKTSIHTYLQRTPPAAVGFLLTINSERNEITQY